MLSRLTRREPVIGSNEVVAPAPKAAATPVAASGSPPEAVSPELDLQRPLMTRSGELVELILTGARGDYCVAGYVGKGEQIERWTRDGRHTSCDVAETDVHPMTLVNVPKHRYVNVFAEKNGHLYLGEGMFAHRGEADRAAFPVNARRVACIRIAPGHFDE